MDRIESISLFCPVLNRYYFISGSALITQLKGFNTLCVSVTEWMEAQRATEMEEGET